MKINTDPMNMDALDFDGDICGIRNITSVSELRAIIIIIIIIKRIYKAPCLRVIKPAQRRYTKVHSIPE